MKRALVGKKKGRDVVTAPPEQRVTQAQPDNSDGHRQVLNRFKAVLAGIDMDGLFMTMMSMSPGKRGTLLEYLDLMDQIREKARGCAKSMLLKDPKAIPGWKASQGVPVRELGRNADKVFKALCDALDQPPSAEEFVAGCTISLSAVRQLLCDLDPFLTPETVEVKLSRVLADLIHYRKGSVILTRVKEVSS